MQLTGVAVYSEDSTTECVIMKVHDDVIKWKQFLRYWPFLRGIHRWNSFTKAADEGFDAVFDLRLNKQLRAQSWGWWFETQSRS